MKRTIAIVAAALAVVTGAVIAPSAAQAATPYKAICIYSTSAGVKSKDWHGKNPQDCNGEYRLYKLNSNSASLLADVQVAQRVGFYKAAKQSEKQLNVWCSAHSFTCAATTGLIFAVINPLLSIARS
jgi:hypothetical protein